MRFLDLSLPTVFENVALDEALVAAADEGMQGPILRVWDIDHTVIVLGASGKREEDIQIEACQRDGVPIARRSSGGGTVVLGPGVLNFTVVIPINMHADLKAVDTAQVWVLERSAEGLRTLNPDVKVLGSGDLTLDTRKFSGSAQRRLKHHLMVHASVILKLDLEAIRGYLQAPTRQPEYRRGRSHENFLTELGFSRIQVIEALRGSWGALESDSADATLLDLAGRLVSEKFGRSDWIERL